MVDVPKCEVIPAAPEPTSESGGGTTSATTTTTTAVSTTAVANGVGAKPVETIVTMSTAGMLLGETTPQWKKIFFSRMIFYVKWLYRISSIIV